MIIDTNAAQPEDRPIDPLTANTVGS